MINVFESGDKDDRGINIRNSQVFSPWSDDRRSVGLSAFFGQTIEVGCVGCDASSVIPFFCLS